MDDRQATVTVVVCDRYDVQFNATVVDTDEVQLSAVPCLDHLAPTRIGHGRENVRVADAVPASGPDNTNRNSHGSSMSYTIDRANVRDCSRGPATCLELLGT